MSAFSFLDEKELVLQVAAGNEQAFNKLFNDYYQLLAAHIFHLTDSVELSEEVVQDVFLKIWLNHDALIGIDNFKGYLFILSKNHAINCLKKIARERKHQKELERLSLNVVQTSETENNKYHLLLDDAINQLPQQQKTVYLLSRHNRLTYAQIAAQLGISHETVKTYLKRATVSITNHIQKKSEIIISILSLFFLIR